MAYLQISKLDMNRTPVIWYRIYNMESFSHNLRTPVSPLPLPEEGADENILVKVEGNSATMSITYKIKEEVTAKDPPIFEGDGIELVYPLSIFQQWSIIQDQFVGISIDDAYKFEFVEVVNDVHITRIEWEGFITDFQVRTGGDSPTVLTASIDFIQGNVITTYEIDGASPPLNVEVTADGNAGIAVVLWDPPTDTGTGGPSIIRYRIQYRIPGDPWETEESTSESETISGLTSGATYRFRVAAINSNQQVGSYSPEVQAVIP